MKGLKLYSVLVGVFASLQVWSQADLSIVTTQNTYQFDGGGQENIITFEFANLGPNPAAGVGVSFTKDMFVDPTFAFNSFASSDFSCIDNIQTMDCTLIATSFDPLTPAFIDLGVIIQPGDFMLNPALIINITDQAGTDPNLANNNLTVGIEYTAAGSPDFQVTLSNPSPPIQYPAGSTMQTMVFEIANVGAGGEGDQTSVTFAISPDLDPLFNNPASANSSDPNWNCFAGSVDITCDYFSPFPPGATSEINLNIPIPDNVPVPAIIMGAVGVSMFNVAGDPDPSNNTFQYDIEIIAGGSPEIEVSKTIVGGVTQVVQGGMVEYLVEVNNTGGVDALDVDLTDVLPAGVTYVSHLELGPNFSCTYVAPTVSCNAPTLPATANVDGVSIMVTADGAINSTVTNMANSPFVDAIMTNNTASVPFTIIGPDADLALLIDTDQTTYTVGDLINIDLNVENPVTSTGAPANVSVVTALPGETVFLSAVVSNLMGWSCNHDGAATGGDVTCDSQGNPLLTGTTADLEIVAVADTATMTLTTINGMVTSDFDSNPSNDNNSTAIDIFAGNADLSIQMTSTTAIYTESDPIDYTFQINNPMGSTASPADVTVEVILPAEVGYVNTDLSAAPGWTCTHDGSLTGGMINCDLGGLGLPPFTTHDFGVMVQALAPSPSASFQASIASAADSNLTDNNTSQSDVINAGISDFSINKTVSGTDFDTGDAFTYVLAVNNPTPSTASPVDVMINDTLPAEVSYDSHVVANNLGTAVVCTHDGSVTGGLFSCDTAGAPFPPGETVTVDINVTAVTASNNVDNSATVETSSDPDGSANNNNDNAITVVINGPAITTVTASKTASVAGVSVSDVNYGQTFEYILEVQNTGANDAENVTVTDTLPADVSWVATQSTGWTCANVGGGDVDCVLDTVLTPGSSAQITVEVIATNNQAINSISNTMDVNGDNTGTVVSSTVVVNLQSSQASLNLSQTPNPVDPGGDVDFNIEVDNTGAVDLNNVIVSSELPTGFTFNGFSGDAAWTCNENAGDVICMYAGVLTGNSSALLNLETTAIPALASQKEPKTKMGPASMLNVTLSANELINDVFETLNVTFNNGDVAIVMSSNPQQVMPGNTFKHLIQIRNNGTSVLNNVSAFYAVPSAATLQSVVAADFNCTVSLGTVSCEKIQSLLIDALTQVEVNLVVNDFVGLVGASASVNADGIINSANTSTQIIDEVENDLAITKTASVSSVVQNGLFSYQFDVLNLGSESQTNFTVIDQLPAGVVYQSFTGENWSCDGNNPLNCIFTGSLTTSSQTQLSIDVIAPAVNGVITNTASINLTQDENASNDSSSVSVNVVDGQGGGAANADLAVVISGNASEVLNTDQVSWQIEISNLGPDVAENVIVTNNLPIGFVAENVQVTDGAECILLQSSLQCDISTLAVSQSTEIILEGGFTNGFSGSIINAVEVESDAIDNNPSNNISSAQVVVSDAGSLNSDLSLELSTHTQQIQQGDEIEFNLIAENLGPDRAVGTNITGQFNGLIDTVQVLDSGGWICQPYNNNGSLDCSFPGDFNVGQTSNIRLSVQTSQVVQESQAFSYSASIQSEGIDSQPGNNMIGFSSEVSRTPTEDEIFAAFENAVGSGASETVIQSIRNVSSYCARSYFMAIEGLCEDFINGATPENGSAIINAMEEITPNEVAAQSNSAAEIITSQFRNVDSRLAQLRGGGGAGFSVAGLNGRYGNESIPLGMLAYLNQSDEERSTSNINDFVSPWGFFVNGSISMGERDATGRELGFDFDTFGITAGVDYRFSPTKVAGLALGYANFDSEIEGEAEMESTGVTLTGYGSFYLQDNFYVDARISLGKPDFEQRRRINFAVEDIIIDRVATGKTDSNQYSVAMSAGYHFNKNSWAITPNASVRYVRTTIDAFQESGAGGFNFAFGEQEITSMVWSLGASVSRAISLKNGVISPQFDFNLSRETENDGGLLEARFINAPDDEIFLIGTDEPDRTYGSAGLGLVFIGSNGRQAYINYRSIFGLEGFTRGTINVGARFEF